MYCRFCGTKNSDEHPYCKTCGKPLALPATQEPIPVHDSSIQPPTQPPPIPSPSAISCPYCHADAQDCHPISKTNVETSSGYSLWNGCCGMLLLGPAGLLCGLCGQNKTSVKSATWWVCKQCGREFMTIPSAVQLAETSMGSAAAYSFVVGGAMGFFSNTDCSFWIFAILALIAVGIWCTIPMTMTEQTGHTLEDLWEDSTCRDLFGQLAIMAVITVLVGLFVVRWLSA